MVVVCAISPSLLFAERCHRRCPHSASVTDGTALTSPLSLAAQRCQRRCFRCAGSAASAAPLLLAAQRCQ
eukprot:6061369-Pleurochrysis_carterae.AAC.1